MKDQLVSIIVPIYNVEKYLEKCVKSIVDQTYSNLEIILVDDGSPDRCPKICDEWALKDKRIKVIHKENGGLSDARNAGLEIAQGEFVSFVDSDDWVDKRFIETLKDILNNEGADIAECGVSYINEDGVTIRNRAWKDLKTKLTKIEALKELVKEEGVFQTVWNKLYRTEIIANLPFVVGKINEDEYWTYQVFGRADSVIVINTPLYNYLQRKNSIMGTGYSIKRLDGLKARFERMEFLQKYPEMAEFTKARVLGDSMYHLQAALKHLQGEEQTQAVEYIIDKIEGIGKVSFRGSDISAKYKIWLTVFKKFPIEVAKFRNRIGIGC